MVTFGVLYVRTDRTRLGQDEQGASVGLGKRLEG